MKRGLWTGVWIAAMLLPWRGGAQEPVSEVAIDGQPPDSAAPPAPAPAPGSTPAAPAPDPRLEALERRQRELEERLARMAERAERHVASAGGVGAGEGGFALRSPDDAFVLILRGYVQSDARLYLDSRPDAASTLLLRRARPVLEGVVFRWFGFKLMPDFGGGQAVVYDAFAEARPLPELVVSFGKFKPPIGLERLQSARHITFVERGLPTNLVPNRDVGIQVAGDIGDGLLLYAVGVFDGVADSGLADGDVNDDKDVAGRLFLRPFRRLGPPPLAQLGLGCGASYGVQAGTPSNPNLPAYKSIGQLTFFSYLSDGTADGTAVAAGTHTRVAPQGYFYLGPVGLLWEYVVSSQGVSRSGQKATLEHTAWQVAASVVLGGRPSFDGVVIAAPLAPRQGHLGALELAARYGEQHLDPDAFPFYADPARSAHLARALSLGLHWYANRGFKVQADLEHARFEGGGAPDRGDESTLLFRTQVAF
jgi:phosphate-selective porin OprO/OprP